MRVVIVEDSRLARLELKQQLSQIADIELVGEAQHAEQGQELIESERPDLLFLDIHLPGKNGFELLETLNYIPHVIFTTAYDQYAVKSFEVNALDYLLKPITNERLQRAISKAQLQHTPVTSVSDDILQSNSRFFVKEKEQCWLVELQQVQLFESIGNYTRLYFEQHKPMIYKSLNQVERRLPSEQFVRANRTELINMNYVKNVEIALSGKLIIQLENGKLIELSKRQGAEFKKRMSL